ncbi:ArsA family ATPase [Streptomyces sp. NPDC050504]|uniref:ArsA family ATPase n=1 Tax=Streptomyces sp. NPDC050504 TaxID=3365618 RepID=UPI0037896F35
MRTVLVTGLGGAGRTTLAAATALAAARRGERVLLLCADPGDSPADVLAVPLPGAQDGPWGEPVEAAPGLWAARIDSGAQFRTDLLALQERGAALLDLVGADRLEGEELTELPGADRLALLRALRAAPGSGHDLVVVDLPPVHDTLATLALPEQLRRYLRRLLPPERQAARALRPMLAQLAGVPMPAQWLYGTAARWADELAAVQAVVEAPTTSLRLVAEPGPAAARALRAARTGLALHGLAVEAVLANRMLPTGSPDPWLAGLAAQQQAYAKELAGPVHEVPHLGRDPRGPEDLALLDPGEPAPAAPVRSTVEDRRAADGLLVWRIPLPGAVKSDLGLVRKGDELLLTVGRFRRVLPLPSALRRCDVAGAGLADGVLSVRFRPDPGQWPRTP